MMASKSRNTAATRAWALDTANASVRVKPRRPYTPYNLFYLLERELVVQGNDPATPVHGGVLSALGMLVARPGRQLSRTLIGLLHDLPMDEVEQILSELRTLGLDALQGEGFDSGDCDALASVDLRYAGQSYTLNLPWRGVVATSEDFHRLHQQRYGHRLELPVELVNLRQWVRGPETEIELPQLPCMPPAKPFDRCVVAGLESPVPQYWRRDLVAGQTLFVAATRAVLSSR